MVKLDDLAFMDATSQAELVRRREVKPIELVDAAVERIERLNPTINAVVTPMYEQARAAASGVLPDGPFTGVPYLLKDLLAPYAGVRMTSASTFLHDYVPDYDCELVARLKLAGLVVLGKTNTPEFGITPTTESRLFGPCRNPWDTGQIAGGSSGGSAAAVAAGMVPAAHGNDGGGSIRIPASCCGLFGLKPTRARTPLGPDHGDICNGLVVSHAITRSVRDSAALLDATSGPDIGDPYWAPPPARPFLEEVGADPGRLRIAFSTENFIGGTVHADCISAVREAAALCVDLGHDVAEAALVVDGEQAAQAFITVFFTSCAWDIDHMARLRGQIPAADLFEPLTWSIYQQVQQYGAIDYQHAIAALQSMARDIGLFFVDYDVLLTPTLAEPPVPLGTFDSPPDNPMLGFLRAAMFSPFTPICNATGQPAMSVPLYWNAEGLPIGTQFIGRFGDEATLFRLAAQLEEARPWADRRPPVSA